MDSRIIDIAGEIETLLKDSGICRAEEFKIRELRRRLESRQLTVSVIGQFKRGKSTLVNAVLGEKLLPVGIVPVTSVVTRIQYGEKSVSVCFDNGIIKPIPFEKLSLYVNEQENMDNHLGVASVTLKAPADFLREGLTFVDTPGVGSVHKNNSLAAYDFVKESDGVIFMLSVDSPVNEIEIDFLRSAREYAGKFYFVINKIDIVEPEELEEYMAYCKKLLCRLMEAEQLTLLPVSAKRGDGIDGLVQLLRRDCRVLTDQILEESARHKLNDIIRCCLERFQLYWSTLNMPAGSLDSKFKEMETALEQLWESSQVIARHRYEAALASASCPEDRRCRDLKNDLQIELNEVKLQLGKMVKGLFDVEFHYEIQELNLEGEKERSPVQQDDIQLQLEQIRGRFEAETEELCQELKDSLSSVLMYREKNAYTVARRIEDFNIATRKLKKLKEML